MKQNLYMTFYYSMNEMNNLKKLRDENKNINKMIKGQKSCKKTNKN